MAELKKIASRYTITRLIGEGGMASVYEAWDTSLERKVAIKFISTNLSNNKTFTSRFKREIKTLAALQHPNIVPVFDHGIHENSLFYVMSLIEGENLFEKIARQPLSPKVFKKISLGVVSALGYAHQKNIIHRDIKPENIFITGMGDPILADFGIAQNQNTEETKLTADGSFIGTIAYASPEQFDGKQLDAGSDIYSLGAVFYYMINGQPPYQGTLTQIITSQLIGKMQPFKKNTAILNTYPALKELVINMLQAQAAQRPRSIAAVQDLLEEIFTSREKNKEDLDIDPPEDREESITAAPEKRPVEVLGKTWSGIKGMSFLAGGVLVMGLILILVLSSGPKEVHSATTPLIQYLTSSPHVPNDAGSNTTEQYYGVNNLIDGRMNWSFQTEGVNGWFQIHFIKKGTYKIEIINGFAYRHPTEGDLYIRNNRVTKVRIAYGDNLMENKIVSLTDGDREYQSLGKFSGSIVRVTILEVSRGEWDHTAISEMRVSQY